MSHDYATVTFEDGQVFHAEYDGTVSLSQASFFESREEITAQWRQPDTRKCSDPANHPQELVEYWTNYGNGDSWDTQACRTCKVITGPRSESIPYERAPFMSEENS